MSIHPKIFVPDFGMGNLHSVRRSLLRLGITPAISADRKDIDTADKIILPGVGHFKTAMEQLEKRKMIDSLRTFVEIRKKPILGICLGMQLMATRSEEGDSKGLGWIDATVIRFNVSDTIKYKIPHIGWNPVSFKKESALIREIPELSEFYFIHSYHFSIQRKEDILGESIYETSFPSAIEHENIFGVQFHPEKSFESGNRLLKNFIEL